MEKNSLIAALREAEEAKFAAVPPEEAVEHVFSEKFRKRMRRLIRVQRTSIWQIINTPSRRALMMFLILLLTFGVRPDQNPLFRYAQPDYPLRTSVPPAPEPEPQRRPAVKERAGAATSAPDQPPAPAETETPSAPLAQPADASTPSAVVPVQSAATAQLQSSEENTKRDASREENETSSQGERTAAQTAPTQVPTDAVTEAPEEREKPWVEYQPLPQPETAAPGGTEEPTGENAGGIYRPLPAEPDETPSYYLPDVSLPEIRDDP